MSEPPLQVRLLQQVRGPGRPEEEEVACLPLEEEEVECLCPAPPLPWAGRNGAGGSGPPSRPPSRSASREFSLATSRAASPHFFLEQLVSESGDGWRDCVSVHSGTGEVKLRLAEQLSAAL